MNEKIKKMQENIVPANNQNRSPFYSYDDYKSGKKILFIGNSITRHGPKAEIGWTFNHGMAASSVENDYVHKLMNKIYEFDPEAKFAIHATWNLEGTFEEFDPLKFVAAREYSPDIIIMFFGANVTQDYKNRSDFKKTFSEACIELRQYVNPDNKAKVYWFGGFYIRPEIDAEKQKAANYFGDIYTSLGDIPFLMETHGKFNHPNDYGMERIADVMWDAIKPDIINKGK